VELDWWGSVIEHEWRDADGNIHYVANAAGAWVTATNPATETSVTLPYSGTLLYWQTPDDSVWTQTATGWWLWTADPATFLEEPGLFYSAGRIFWSGWEPPTYKQSGRLIDLCPILAS